MLQGHSQGPVPGPDGGLDSEDPGAAEGHRPGKEVEGGEVEGR